MVSRSLFTKDGNADPHAKGLMDEANPKRPASYGRKTGNLAPGRLFPRFMPQEDPGKAKPANV